MLNESMTKRLLSANSLNDECILITGGGTGLGFAVAQELVRLGAHVHICGRRTAVLEEAAASLSSAPGAEGKVSFHTTDIRDAASVEAMFEQIWQTGPLTALVNNAAANFVSPTERLSSRAFDAVANTVMHGTFYVTLAAGKRWIATGKPGSIVSIVNTGVVNGAPFTVPAVMSKAGICAMTRSLAIEWGRHAIRLNAIGPGSFPTPGAQARLSLAADGELQARRNPMKRTGRLDELRTLVAFLLSRECEYLTGQVIMLDGAHHLANGNLFSGMLDLSPADWDELAISTRSKDVKHKPASTSSASKT